jgi:hypothetical protein
MVNLLMECGEEGLSMETEEEMDEVVEEARWVYLTDVQAKQFRFAGDCVSEN